jgi:transposase
MVKSAPWPFAVPVGESPNPRAVLAGKTDVLPDILVPAALSHGDEDFMRIVAGVDCHKSTHTVVFLNGAGVVCDSLTFPTNASGYQTALDMAAGLGCVEWGLEGSGSYGFAFAVFASSVGALVFDVPGLYTKRHRRHSSQHGKSDVNDAKAIAEVVLREDGRLSRFFLASIQRALRMRYDRRDRLVRERTGAVNRLRSSSLLIGVASLPADLTPTKTARRLATLAATFRRSTTVDHATAAVLDELEDAAEAIQRLNVKIRSTEGAIRELVRRLAPELLSLHGISDVAAAGLIGHSGDMRNLRNAAAFATKCGAAPVQCSSGRRESVRVNLGGDRQLNRLLHVVAMSQVRRCGHPGRKYYERKRAEGKTHLAAMRCLKRTLATIIFYRLRDADRRLTEEGRDLILAA